MWFLFKKSFILNEPYTEGLWALLFISEYKCLFSSYQKLSFLLLNHRVVRREKASTEKESENFRWCRCIFPPFKASLRQIVEIVGGCVKHTGSGVRIAMLEESISQP